jgi:hypothetical protein
MGGLDDEQRSDRKITELTWTPGGPLHECAGGVMHAGRFRSASPFAEPPTRTLQAAGRTAQGCPIYPPGEDSLRFRYGTLVSAHGSPAQNPDPASGTQLGEDTVLADETPARTIESSPDAPGPYSGFPLR